MTDTIATRIQQLEDKLIELGDQLNSFGPDLADELTLEYAETSAELRELRLLS